MLANKTHNNLQDHNTDPDSIKKYQYRFIHHFLPHEHNKKRATLLSNSAFTVYVFGFLAIFLVASLIPKAMPGVLGYASNITISDLLTKTNEERVERGLSELRLNPQLSQAANSKAAHMFEFDYWAHVAPNGTEPWDFILGADYDYSYAGENLAKNFRTSNEVVKAWMESPTHRENLLNENYDEIGFAVVDGVLDGYETTLVVQMFGRPRDPSLVATVETEQQLLQGFAAEAAAAPQNTPAQEIAAVPESNNAPGESTLITNNPITQAIEQLPSVQSTTVDVTTAYKTIAVSFGIFLVALLGVDVWYSRKKGILKINGHTFAHITILLVALGGVLFVLRPGSII